MLLPYNVDRPARRVPRVTYCLMAANVAIYLLTVVMANIYLPADRAAFRESMGEMMEETEAGDESDADGDSSSNDASNGTSDGASSSGSSSGFSLLSGQTLRMQAVPAPPAPQPSPTGSQPAAAGDQGSEADSSAGNTMDESEFLDEDESEAAILEKLKKDPDSVREMYRRSWIREHYNDSFVLDPHPSTLDVFAYHASSPTLISLFTSMFLHGGLEHLLGNMLFLWVFGRAIEDALGPLVYGIAYFVCGIAATLLFHTMMVQFTPATAGIHAMGASGAIAGVQGLFAPRFYRTPVSIFYTNAFGARIFYLASGLIGFALSRFMGTPGYTLAALGVLAALVVMGEDTAWGEFKLGAAWLIGGWVLLKDLAPALFALATNQQGGGVAHWAHIGGFLCGVSYALLIGSKSEGQTEYLIEDARRSLDNKYAGNAIEDARKLVEKQPDNPAGYQLLAEAHDIKNNENEALDNYELAIAKYLKTGDRQSAARLYLDALKKHPLFILQPREQIVLAGQMATDLQYLEAAENLAKVPFTFPDAPESEISLLRAAQIYIDRLNQPDMGLHLLRTLLERHPDTQWMSQVETAQQKAHHLLTNPPDPAAGVLPPAPPPKGAAGVKSKLSQK